MIARFNRTRALSTHTLVCLAVVAAASVANVANAQYVWVDSKGVRHYSDRAPDLSIPANKILRMPDAQQAEVARSEAAKADPAKTDGLKTDPGDSDSTAQKNADFQRRRQAQQEKDGKAADEAQRKAAQAADCQRLVQYQKALGSGERIAVPDKNGERSYLSDEQRVREMQDNARRLGECKKGG